MLDLELIRIDGGTQSRAKLNDDVVAEYAEAYKAGAKFPPVTVFFDGKDRWLADGFHRYFAAKQAGKTEILENITPGTKRDAILFSLGANGTHGLNRTNADKRNAVTTMLADSEWAAWSNVAVAKACSVSEGFVRSLRINEVTAPAERTYTTKHGTTATMQTGAIGQASPAAQVTPTPAPALAPEDAPEDDGPSAEELAAHAAAEAADRELMAKLLDSNEPLAELAQEIKQLKAENVQLKQRVNGLMSEKNEAIALVKARDRQIAKLEKLLKAEA